MTDPWSAPSPGEHPAPPAAGGVPGAPAWFGSPPGWYPDPGGGPLRRWWDGGAWTDQVGGLGGEWEPLRGLARWTVSLIGLTTLVEAYVLMAFAGRYRTVTNLLDGEFDAIDVVNSDRQVAIALTLFVLALVTAGTVFIVWFHRAYRDAASLQRVRYPQWTVWGWLTPFVAMFRPKQMVNDLWAATDENTDPGSPPVTVWPVVQLWWIAWLLSGVLFWVGRATTGTTDSLTFERLRQGAVVSMFAAGLGILAGVFAMLWVLRATDRLERRHSARVDPPSTGITQPVT